MIDKILYQEISKALAAFCDEKINFTLEKPANSDFGDFATNLAMMLAGKLKKSPMQIAEEFVAAFPKSDLIEKIEIKAPGFINFYLNKGSLSDILDEIVTEKDNFGKGTLGKKQKVALEHTNVNPNKALHIGHLRNACLGSSCERILEFLDYDVETQYYVDDTGVQVAVTYLGVKNGLDTPKEGQKYDHFAQDLYVKTMDLIDKNEDYKTAQQEIIHELDQQKGEDVIPAKDFAEKIIRSNLVTMNNLQIDYDLLIWESDIIQTGFWRQAFEILKELKDVFVLDTDGKNAGCWVIRNVGDEDKVIVKSNGVVTYTGKDIAYHLWKFDLLSKDFNYKPWTDSLQAKELFTSTMEGKQLDKFGRADVVVNFIDVRQTFPQLAVKESLKTLGFNEEAENLKHVGYGIVFLSPKTAKELGIDTTDNKSKYAMSGRKGIGILADDLFDLVKSKVEEAYPDSKVASEVAVSAIKYHMLKFNTLSDIVFDLDQALDFHGNSGPYLQYTFARTQSILRKATDFGKDIQTALGFSDISDEEKELITTLSGFQATVEEAGQEFSPNLLCNYLFELCQKFNTYYAKNTVVSTKNESDIDNFRVLLTAAVGTVLKNGLTLLGIPAPEKM
jgi:arginyl-tRNA synthetase